MQGHLLLRRAAHHQIIRLLVAPATLVVVGAIVMLTALALIAGGTSAQEPAPAEATPVMLGAEQSTVAPDPSDAPTTDPTETPVPPTEPPTETPTVPPPTETPTATIPPTATVSPTATVTPSPTGTAVPTIPPTVAPTVPPATLAPTSPAVIEATEAPATRPDTGQNMPGAGSPITLSDRFDNPSMRLLGETRPNQTQTTGRYEDGHYRLEINGPEVAPDLIAQVRSPILVDASIHVSAQLEGTIQDRYVMATCREVEGYGGYRVYLSPHDGYFAITRFEPGALPTILQEGPADELIQGSDRFEFDFSCTGYVLELKVNGETIGIAADNSFAAGTISIGTGYFANASPGPVTALFQDLEVTGNIGMAGAIGPIRQGRSPWGPARSVATLPAALRPE